jgi:pyruvate/2-oxoglutarate dehydrogenase complex dihydrolipoamide dehydrogenase (E3) component
MEITIETAIIGGGQAGVPLARALAAAGRGVVLIEREHLGGSCVNFGCTPSKAIIASARLAADVRRAAELGIDVRGFEVDFPAVMDRARGLVAQAKGELDASFADKANPRLLTAHGRLDGREDGYVRIRAGDTLVRAKRLVLDTGTRSVRPSIPGLGQVPVITAETWIALRERPRHVLMLGGSYIGVEMAQAFRRLGCNVTVFEQAGQLAEREDPDVAAVLQAALERDGCRVHVDVAVERIEAVPRGVRIVFAKRSLKEGSVEGHSVEGSHLFLATGRQPNTDDLGLETIGVRMGDHGIVQVDDRLRCNVPGLWAVGDIRGGPAFTHTAYDDFRVLASQFLGDGSDKNCRIVPYAMFTDPELGRVGLSEVEARKTGRAIRIGRHSMKNSGKARDLGKTDGFIKVVVDDETDTILGAAAVCEQGAELVQLFVELMNTGATVETVRGAVHIHPTLAEAAKNAVLGTRP